MKSSKASRKVKAKKKTTRKVVQLAPFDAAEYLVNEDIIAEYLAAAIENPNPDVFLAAMADVAKARGISAVAKESGLTRAGIYRGLSAGSTPSFSTVMKITRALGVKLVPQKAAQDTLSPLVRKPPAMAICGTPCHTLRVTLSHLRQRQRRRLLDRR